MPAIGILCGIAVFALLIIWISIFPRKGIRYIPAINISVSNDNINYNTNIMSVAISRDFYIKFDVSVKANGILWRLMDNTIPFIIKYPDFKNFECHIIKATCRIISQNTGCNTIPAHCFYCKNWYKIPGHCFLATASDMPKKTTVIIKCRASVEDISKQHEFSIKFWNKRISDAYASKIQIGFIKW
jgi:hypothetical protein